MKELTFISFILFPLFLIAAPTVPTDPMGALKLVQDIYAAILTKNWAMVGSLVVFVLVYAYRTFILPKTKFSPKILPLISAGIGIAVAVAGNIFIGDSFLQAIIGGVFIGNAASGFWSTVKAITK